MTTLHVDTGREMRGGQRQALLLVEELAARGEQISVLARHASPLFHHLRSARIRVHHASLSNLMREAKAADVLHAHDARAHALAAVASRKPLVVSRRVVFPIRQSFVSTWKYRRADAYLAVSRAVASQLELAGVATEKIKVVYDAVPSAVLSWKWRPGAPVVTFASEDPAKGTELVRVASTLWGDAPLVFSTNLASDLPHASVFLYITRSEGLGSAALLAMSMGVPVIASHAGGLLEVFEHERSGLHVPNNTADIAASVKRVTADRELAERLSLNGYHRVRELFSVDAMVDKTLATYRDLL